MTPLANRLGIIQGIIWVIGIWVMAGTMHIVGLLGAPRRSNFSTYGGDPTAAGWHPYMIVAGIGRILLFIGVLMYLGIVLYLLLFAPQTDTPVEYPIGELRDESLHPPLVLERWTVWIGVTIVLILAAYTVPIMHMLQHSPVGSLPHRTW